MAGIIAEALEGELDVVLVHKLGAPGQPELAIGAVNEMGDVYVGEHARTLGVSADVIDKEAQVQVSSLRKRREYYTPYRLPVDPAGRVVIVVDNGIATGATMISALRTLRRRNPKKLVAAIAVAPSETLARIQAEADEVVCLHASDAFFAVGGFFEDFSQVTDERVVAILRQAAPRQGASA